MKNKHFLGPLLTGALITVSLPAKAIVNVEDLRLDSDQPGWTGSATLNFAGKSGNTDNFNGSANIGVQFNHQKATELFLASYEVSETQQQRTDESQFLHLRHTQTFRPAWDWEAYTQYEATPLVLNKTRSLLGAGLRWTVKKNAFTGNLAGSIFYENEQVDLSAGRTAFEVGRFNWMAQGQYQLSQNAKAGLTLFFQPKVDQWENNRTIAKMAVDSKLTGQWSLAASLDYKHDSQPYQNLKSDDWAYGMGLNYQF
jgi:putative salt-induced outer membrane protein YdiY